MYESSSPFESESYVTTNGQSASRFWNKAPIWDLLPDFYYSQTVAGFLMWGTLFLQEDRSVILGSESHGTCALSYKRTGLSFKIGAGSRQHSHSWVWVLWYLWQCFIVSDSRLPFLLPPITHRATVEVFNPASTWDFSSGNLLSFSNFEWTD
jgi:hypothetical protein